MQDSGFEWIHWPEEALTDSWVAIWIAILALVVSMVGVVVAGLAISATKNAIRNQTGNSRIEKMADAVLQFGKRYEKIRAEVMKLKSKLPTGQAVSHEMVDLERQFWSLQFEQWEFYQLGLVPHEIMERWLKARVTEFREPKIDSMFTEAMPISWKNNRKTYRHAEEFQRFVDRIEAVAAALGPPSPHQESITLPAVSSIEALVSEARKESDNSQRDFRHALYALGEK